MTLLVPFTPARFADIVLQPEQQRDTFDMTVPERGPCYCLEVDGHTVACGGLFAITDHVAVAWAFIGADAGPYFVRMLRAMADALADAPWPVVRAGVLDGFGPGARMLTMLGFQPIGASVTYGARVYDVFEYVNHVH